MKTDPIFTETDIDETAAKDYLTAPYGNLDLLPRIPETLTESIAATVLNVSEPTIKRMAQDRQITLEKRSILAYIHQKMLVNRPLNLPEPLPK